MKKILSVIMIFALVALIFTLAACGSGEMKDDVRDEMTTLKDGATSMMEGISSAASDMAEDLTQGGNVTKDNSSTGLIEQMTSDSESTTLNDATTEKETTDNSTTDTSAENMQ